MICETCGIEKNGTGCQCERAAKLKKLSELLKDKRSISKDELTPKVKYHFETGLKWDSDLLAYIDWIEKKLT